MLQKLVTSGQESSSEEGRADECFQRMRDYIEFEGFVTGDQINKVFRKDFTVTEVHFAKTRLAQDPEIRYDMADFENGLDGVREIYVYGREITPADRLKLFY